MSLAVMLILQAAVPTIGEAATNFDLRRIGSTQACARDVADEIVVCGSMPEDARKRLTAPSAAFEPVPLKATIGIIGSVTGTLHGETAQFPGGIVSHRAMITLKMPF